MIARDLMTTQPYVLLERETVRRAAELMQAHDVGFIPVVKDERAGLLAGVITDRDIAMRCVAKGLLPDASVASLMTKEPLATVRPESPVEEVVELMKRARVRRLPVVDGEGKVVGVIALADVVRSLGKREPGTVEEVLERVSDAVHALA